MDGEVTAHSPPGTPSLSISAFESPWLSSATILVLLAELRALKINKALSLCRGSLMRCFAALSLGCILLAMQEPCALSQTTAAQASQTPVLSAHSTLVLVPALVRSKAGDLVFTLTADDFTLTDDGVPQKLMLEQDTGGEPLALVVVIEIGGAGAREFNKYDSLAPGLAPMLESIIGNVPHKVAVVTFDSQPALLQDFTSNTDTAANAIRTLTPGCTRQHDLDDCASPPPLYNVGLGAK